MLGLMVMPLVGRASGPACGDVSPGLDKPRHDDPTTTAEASIGDDRTTERLTRSH